MPRLVELGFVKLRCVLLSSGALSWALVRCGLLGCVKGKGSLRRAFSFAICPRPGVPLPDRATSHLSLLQFDKSPWSKRLSTV